MNALRYLIGLDHDEGRDDAYTVIGYDATDPPKNGVKYCNLLDEHGTREFGPYLPDNDMTAEYGEPVPDPESEGFWRNIRHQLDLAVEQGFKFVELDNLDSYNASVALLCFNEVQSRGLKVFVKNPLLVDGDHAAMMRHPAACGAIVEKDCGTPADMAAIRLGGQPVSFVSFGDGRSWAQQIANQIRAQGLVDMGVTYSNEGEYASSDDILLPLGAKPTETPMATGAEIIAKARSYIGQIEDGPDVPRIAREIGKTFPEFATYVTEAGNSTPWCGIFVAYVLSQFGIKPPPTTGGVGFMWVDTWAKWGSSVSVGNAQPGDVAVFLGNPHHVTFVAGNGRYVGGNQGDAVTETTFRTPDYVRRAPAASAQPIVSSGNTNSGKGSWYSQYSGKYEWVDNGDAPNSNALGVPDDAQGIAFYDRDTLGQWFAVTAPNGVTSVEQQTDIGPAPRTGRLIDISAAAAERFGYTPRNFPTDSIFEWRAVPAPSAVAGLDKKQQAVRWRDLRQSAPTEPPKPNPQPSPDRTELEAAGDAAEAKVVAAVRELQAAAEAAARHQIIIPPAAPDFQEILDKIPDRAISVFWPRIQALVQSLDADDAINLKRRAASGGISSSEIMNMLGISLWDVLGFGLGQMFGQPSQPTNLPVPYQPPKTGFIEKLLRQLVAKKGT